MTFQRSPLSFPGAPSGSSCSWTIYPLTKTGHEYKELKAILEGSLAARPGNVLIYATSNQRHLVKETFHDRDGSCTDRIRSKKSFPLADRFGITVTYLAPDKAVYLSIVEGPGAPAWSRHRHAHPPSTGPGMGGLEQRPLGRTARQFIDHLIGGAGFEGLDLLGNAQASLILPGRVQDYGGFQGCEVCSL